MEEFVRINQERCTKCGACIDECPARILWMGEEGPEAAGTDACIECGHCVAVCPTAALDNKKAPLRCQTDLKDYVKPGPREAERFLRSRRSVRAFKKEPVPREKLLELLDIARYAPTAKNTQGISYLIVEDRNTLMKAAELTIEYWENNPTVQGKYRNFIKFYREKGIDTIFRGAPQLIVAMADRDLASGRNNTIFSLAYVELYAPSLGLGTCWAGYMEHYAFEKDSSLPALFRIPEGKVITGAMMAGYPKYRYSRLVERNPLDARFFDPAE